MGKYILYALLVIGASSLANWTTLGRGGYGYGSGYGTRGGWIGGGGGGGFSSSGTGHK